MFTNKKHKFTGNVQETYPVETETNPASIFSGKITTLKKVIYLPLYRDSIPNQAQFGDIPPGDGKTAKFFLWCRDGEEIFQQQPEQRNGKETISTDIQQYQCP
jgi:hypothetical protein